MYRIYRKDEFRRQLVTIAGKTFNNVLCDNNGNIISGYDHFIGKDEKRRSNSMIHIEFPYNSGNYQLFYDGSQKILEKACKAIDTLLTEKNLSERKKSELYGILIKSLLIVHHVNTEKRKSKLNGINSLSTSCIDNCFCVERMKNSDSICSHCYSATQQKQQLALQDRNTINGIILRNIIIPAKYWKKYINPTDLSKFFRIESFGDVANKTQALNYIEFMKAFKRIHFAVWSKNHGIWYFAIQKAGKPENMVYIASSNRLNCCDIHLLKTYEFIDHIFTVYDKKFICMNNITITCGGRSCMKDCIKKGLGCYYRNTAIEQREEKK